MVPGTRKQIVVEFPRWNVDYLTTVTPTSPLAKFFQRADDYSGNSAKPNSASQWCFGWEGFATGLRQWIADRSELSAKVIKIGMITPMDCPTIAEHKCIEFDEREPATLGDRRIIQDFLKFRQAVEAAWKVKETIAVVSSLLIDPALVLSELDARAVSEDAGTVFGKPVVATDLLIDRGEKVGVRDCQVQVRVWSKTAPNFSSHAIRRNAEAEFRAAAKQEMMWMDACPSRQVIDETGVLVVRWEAHWRSRKESVVDQSVGIVERELLNFAGRKYDMPLGVKHHCVPAPRQGSRGPTVGGTAHSGRTAGRQTPVARDAGMTDTGTSRPRLGRMPIAVPQSGKPGTVRHREKSKTDRWSSALAQDGHSSRIQHRQPPRPPQCLHGRYAQTRAILVALRAIDRSQTRSRRFGRHLAGFRGTGCLDLSRLESAPRDPGALGLPGEDHPLDPRDCVGPLPVLAACSRPPHEYGSS
jgi:hypothetical protein